MFTEADRIRKQAILHELASGSIDDMLFAELKKLNEQQSLVKAQRAVEIEKVIQTITTYGIDLGEIASAFQKSRLREWAQQSGFASDAKKAAPKLAGVGAVSRSKRGDLVVIEMMNPTGKGVPARIHRAQKLPAYVPAAFKALLQSSGDNFDSALVKFFTEDGKAYFGTDEGKVFLTRFIRFVKTRPSVRP